MHYANRKMWGLLCYPFQLDAYQGLDASNEERHDNINYQNETAVYKVQLRREVCFILPDRNQSYRNCVNNSPTWVGLCCKQHNAACFYFLRN